MTGAPIYNREQFWAEEGEPIHLWFSLSYSNYLVLARSVLQSMPQEWQARFVVLLEEMNDSYGHLDWPAYEVRALVRHAEVIEPTCEECDGEGEVVINPDWPDGEDPHSEKCQTCGGMGYMEGEHRYETAEEVGFRTDPIPHYNRGRTIIPPRER